MKVNTRELRKILNESLVNPNKPGPWKVVADIGVANPAYLRLRAIELLEENQGDETLRKAITMLLLARYFKEEESKNASS